VQAHILPFAFQTDNYRLTSIDFFDYQTRSTPTVDIKQANRSVLQQRPRRKTNERADFTLTLGSSTMKMAVFNTIRIVGP